MELLGIEIDAGVDVADEGVIGPAVPEPGDDIEELAGAAIALAMLHMLLQPEVQRRIGIGGGDEIPAGAPAADMVEGGEFAREVIGLVEGGGRRGDQAEMLGHDGQRRQQGQRIEGGDGGAALQRVHRHVEHGQMIGHEEGIEAPALQGLGEALQMGEVEIRIGKGAGIAPGAGMQAHGPHEGPQAQLPRSAHGQARSPIDVSGHRCRRRRAAVNEACL